MTKIDDVGFDLYLSRDYLKAGLLVSLLSVWVLVGVFYYLNRFTKRRYFSIWTVAWLFYALWLTLDLSLRSAKNQAYGIMLRQWCISVAATFLLWGSLNFLGRRAPQGLLTLFMGFLFVWSYIGAYHLEGIMLITIPIFTLIGLASMFSTWGFLIYRRRRENIGASLLAFGFLGWGTYLIAYPFLQLSDDYATTGFFVSTVLQLFIAVSMIILVLEQVRFANFRRANREIQLKEREKKVLQKQVVTTEERYWRLFDQASEAIVIAAASDLRILEINQRGESMLGIEKTNSSRHALTAFTQPPSIASKTPKTGLEWFDYILQQHPFNLVRKDGNITPTEVQGALIEYEGQKACQLFIREVTDRARLEQQLRQAEKLSSLGQMISGLTHEMNNCMTVIHGLIDIVLGRNQVSEKDQRQLSRAAEETGKASQMLKNFLTLARENPGQPEFVSINDLVHRISDLRRFECVAAGIELNLVLADGLPGTTVIPDQVQQIIINLMNNSMYALKSVQSQPILQVVTKQENGKIVVIVEDNGPGVPEQLRQKIFEPYFTTKPAGIGTGLGLSIIHGIMHEHHGRIYYQPSSLGGAGFVLEFPIRDEYEAVSPARAANTQVATDLA